MPGNITGSIWVRTSPAWAVSGLRLRCGRRNRSQRLANFTALSVDGTEAKSAWRTDEWYVWALLVVLSVVQKAEIGPDLALAVVCPRTGKNGGSVFLDDVKISVAGGDGLFLFLPAEAHSSHWRLTVETVSTTTLLPPARSEAAVVQWT